MAASAAASNPESAAPIGRLLLRCALAAAAAEEPGVRLAEPLVVLKLLLSSGLAPLSLAEAVVRAEVLLQQANKGNQHSS